MLSQIDRHVRTAIQDQHADPQTNNTLFELLLPNEAKLELEALDNLHLLVDDSTAWIPWEIIAGRETTDQQQPAAHACAVPDSSRQLKPGRPRAPPPDGPLAGVTEDALVIGDPPSGPVRPGLPGARGGGDPRCRQARRCRRSTSTACIFEDSGAAERKIRPQACSTSSSGSTTGSSTSRRTAASMRSPRAADRNGVVISADEVLGPVQFRQRLVAPDLVFLNCCHIGRIDDDPATRR